MSPTPVTAERAEPVIDVVFWTPSGKALGIARFAGTRASVVRCAPLPLPLPLPGWADRARQQLGE